MANHIGRREFISLLGGAAIASPLAAQAQQPKRVGMLMNGAATDPNVETVARYRLPAIYGNYNFMAEGGLMHYRNDLSEPYRLAPFYVDRIPPSNKVKHHNTLHLM